MTPKQVKPDWRGSDWGKVVATLKRHATFAKIVMVLSAAIFILAVAIAYMVYSIIC